MTRKMVISAAAAIPAVTGCPTIDCSKGRDQLGPEHDAGERDTLRHQGTMSA
jgi:hypothetical protein